MTRRAKLSGVIWKKIPHLSDLLSRLSPLFRAWTIKNFIQNNSFFSFLGGIHSLQEALPADAHGEESVQATMHAK